MRRLADRPAVAAPPPVTHRRRLRLTLAALAVLLAAADTYVVVLALPEIMVGVGLGVTELDRAAPIVSVFLLGYVAALPLVGRLSDLHGRLPVLLGCLLLFAAGSAVTATATDLGVLVAGRGLQGIGGGGLVPVTLGLVADCWRAERRGVPLGLVGAAQELGAVLGPLLGAAVLAVSGWRAIFWANLVTALVLALGLRAVGAAPSSSDVAVVPHLPARAEPDQAGSTADPRRRPDLLGGGLLLLVVGSGLLLLARPSVVADDVTWGALFVPAAGPLSPLALLLAVATLGLVAWSALVPPTVRPLLPLRGLPGAAGKVDLLGAALLAGALGCVVLTFSAAESTRQVVADDARYLLPLAGALTVALIWRERRARHPLVPGEAMRPRGSWGGQLVNLLVGAALIAVLVDVPIFARATVYPDDQLAAALVLLRFLAAVPVGAVLGGLAYPRMGVRPVAAGGLVLAAGALATMTTWSADELRGLGRADVGLVVAGLGIGLAVAPVNAAVLDAVRPALHGLASALVVVARSVGMLVGLSVLTAVGLRVFAVEQTRIGSPLTLCPSTPGRCPAYDAALRSAVLSELHVIFAGAAVAALLAAILAAALLRPVRARYAAPHA